MYRDFPDFIQASGERQFLGRTADAEAVLQRLARSESGPGPLLSVDGPAGIGKSQLLRHAAVLLLGRGAAWLPLYFNFEEPGVARPGPEIQDDARLRSEVFRSLLRQLVAYDRNLALLAPPLAGGEAAEIGPLAYAAGLGDWIERLDRPWTDPARAEETWRGLLRSRIDERVPRPCLVFDGLSPVARDSPVWTVLLELTRAAVAEGLPVLIEGGHGAWPFWNGMTPLEFVTLKGLDSGDAMALIELQGADAGGMPAAGGAARVLARLGGNPALLRDWTAAWDQFSEVQNKVRRAESAYLHLISRGPTARHWKARFDRVVPPLARPPVLRLLAALAEGDTPGEARAFGFAEFAARSSLGAGQAEAVLGGLEYEGFLRRGVDACVSPPGEVLRDWIAFQASCAEDGHEAGGRPQAEFMRRLLARGPVAQGESPAAWLEPLLGRFSLQRLPQALFQYDQYYEALGEIPPEKREREVMQTSLTVQLPETIGVVLDPPSGLRAGSARAFALYFAHGYRDGIYRRGNEETWIVGDFTIYPTLTSLEVELFHASSAELERRLGPGRYTRWILAGDSVSPEALDLLNRAKTFCSAVEQLRILRRALEPAALKTRQVAIPTRAGLAPSIQSPPAGPRHTPVIPIAEVGEQEAGHSISRLSLVAQQQNEVIAASMAERIAQRGGFDPQSVGQIKMAVLEGCLNAIEHSLNPEKEIRLTFQERPGELEIAIENEGDIFDPLAVGDPDPATKLKDKNKRGWGIKLMREFMDDVRYEPARGGMCLRLIKRKPVRDAERKPSGARKA
jgi:serine/threonine-protein kinase RsbW